MINKLTWPVVAIALAVLGGTAFLGYVHVLTGQFVGGIYSAIVTGVIVGHYAGNSNGGSTG